MKKLISVLLSLSVLFSLFAVSSYALKEYKCGGYLFTIPTALQEDKAWGEENGYVNSWLSLDSKFEVMAGTEFYGHFGPITDKETPDCRHFDEKTTNSSFEGGYDGEVKVGEVTAGKTSFEVKNEDGSSFTYYRYEITSGEKKRLVLTFFIHDKEYENFVDEIINSVKEDKTPSFLNPKFLLQISVCVVAVFLWDFIKGKKKAKKNK